MTVVSVYRPCEVSADCLGCPLTRCKHDAPVWFRTGVLRGRWYAIAAAAERMGPDGAATHFGISKRTVFRAKGITLKDGNSLEDRAVFAALAGG